MQRLAGTLLVIALLALPATTLAHGENETGDLSISIGMINEPVSVGLPSGFEVALLHADGDPVADATLTLEVSIAGMSRSFELLADPMTPGRYAVPFTPTLPGAYRVHLTGMAAGHSIDLEMVAGPTTFSEVAAAGGVSFPLPLPDPVSTAALAREAADRAAFALFLAGVAGAAALSSLVALRRRR